MLYPKIVHIDQSLSFAGAGLLKPSRERSDQRNYVAIVHYVQVLGGYNTSFTPQVRIASMAIASAEWTAPTRNPLATAYHLPRPPETHPGVSRVE